MFWIRAPKEYQALRVMYDESGHWVGTENAVLFGRTQPVSGWSPAQHLHHAESINKGILAALVRVCQPGHRLPDDTSRTFYGYSFMVIGRLPRGQGRSPKRFIPPETPDRADLQALLASNRERVEEIGLCLETLRTAEGRMTHPVFGGLDALDWLRFARIHTDHHHAIIRDILDAQSAPV